MKKRLLRMLLLLTLVFAAFVTIGCATQRKAGEKAYQTEKPKNKSGKKNNSKPSSDNSSGDETSPPPPPPPTY